MTGNSSDLCRRYSRFGNRPNGFSLPELLVVIGMLALLLAILLPALNRARARAWELTCSSSLRQLGAAFHSYANDNSGWVPRDHSPWVADRRPYWMVAIGPYLEARDDWNVSGPALTAELAYFQCPAHPSEDGVPGDFIVNAFRFELEPSWDPAGPARLSQIDNASDVVWLAEASDVFGETGLDGSNNILLARYHDAWHPDHLPEGSKRRISDERHRAKANILMFDGSARSVGRGKMRLEQFDDGVTQRNGDTIID